MGSYIVWKCSQNMMIVNIYRELLKRYKQLIHEFKRKVNDNDINKNYNKCTSKASWNVARNKTNKSNDSCEKYFFSDDFNQYFIDSAIVLKQLSAHNSLDKAANSFSGISYVDTHFEWAHNLSHDVIKSGQALKTSKSTEDLSNDVLKNIVC